MKQTILNYYPAKASRGICLGRMLFIWGLYGLAMEWIWRLAGGGAVAQTAVWAFAGLAALWLVLVAEEA